MDGGTDEEERNNGVEQSGSCPTHGWVGKHELFGELEREII